MWGHLGQHGVRGVGVSGAGRGCKGHQGVSRRCWGIGSGRGVGAQG